MSDRIHAAFVHISKSPISPQRLKFRYFLTVVTELTDGWPHGNVQCRQSSQFTQCKWLDFKSSGVVVPPKDMTLCSITSKTSIQHRSRMFQMQNRIHSWQQFQDEGYEKWLVAQMFSLIGGLKSVILSELSLYIFHLLSDTLRCSYARHWRCVWLDNLNTPPQAEVIPKSLTNLQCFSLCNDLVKTSAIISSVRQYSSWIILSWNLLSDVVIFNVEMFRPGMILWVSHNGKRWHVITMENRWSALR
jgi:hypothetical protein